MKRLIIALALLISAAASAGAGAAPFVVAEVEPGVASCNVYLDTAPAVNVPAVADAASPTGWVCKYDLSALASGSHSVQLTAFNPGDALLGGPKESVKSSPLALSKPAAPAAPARLRLSL